MIPYTTTAQIHGATWEWQDIALEIEESKLAELQSLEGQFQAHQDFISQGIREGWIRTIS